MTKGIGGHQSHSAATVEWLTPPEIIAALGGWQSIEVDPCAPIEQPYPTARKTYTILDDGLAQEWPEGLRHFVNPPYDFVERWLEKLSACGCGTAMIFARMDTEWFARWVRPFASAILFMEGRPHFHIGEAFSDIKTRRTYQAGDRAKGNAGGPIMLCTYGEDDADILAECGVPGLFVPLIWTRNVLVEALGDVTWRELVVGVLMEADGAPVAVAAVWRAIRAHPKAQGKKHGREQIRKVLQQQAERVGRGQYRMAI